MEPDLTLNPRSENLTDIWKDIQTDSPMQTESKTKIKPIIIIIIVAGLVLVFIGFMNILSKAKSKFFKRSTQSNPSNNIAMDTLSPSGENTHKPVRLPLSKIQNCRVDILGATIDESTDIADTTYMTSSSSSAYLEVSTMQGCLNTSFKKEEIHDSHI